MIVPNSRKFVYYCCRNNTSNSCCLLGAYYNKLRREEEERGVCTRAGMINQIIDYDYNLSINRLHFHNRIIIVNGFPNLFPSFLHVKNRRHHKTVALLLLMTHQVCDLQEIYDVTDQEHSPDRGPSRFFAMVSTCLIIEEKKLRKQRTESCARNFESSKLGYPNKYLVNNRD